MGREFEFKQLLRAYHSGIISEAGFEQEMARLEAGGAASVEAVNGAGFHAFGRTYKTERAAVVSFIDKAGAAEANGAEAFRRWASVCKTDCLRSGLRMIAEREAYHARIFEQRMRDLGAEQRATTTEEGRKFTDFLTDANGADTEKLLYFMRLVGDGETAIKPIYEFAALLREDLETKEMLRLFAEDEASSVRWIRDACVALNARSAAASA
jgi:rubrerythrin